MRSVVKRMRFPHKAFVGQFTYFTFGGQGNDLQVLTGDRSSNVVLPRRPKRGVVAQGVGYAFWAWTSGESVAAKYTRLVRSRSRRGDCVRRNTGRAGCTVVGDFGAAFGRAYCCKLPYKTREGARLSRGTFKRFVKRVPKPFGTCWNDGELLYMSEQGCGFFEGLRNPKMVNCYFAETNENHRIPDRVCADDGGVPRP